MGDHAPREMTVQARYVTRLTEPGLQVSYEPVFALSPLHRTCGVGG
jgi:hypothetical protein